MQQQPHVSVQTSPQPPNYFQNHSIVQNDQQLVDLGATMCIGASVFMTAIGATVGIAAPIALGMGLVSGAAMLGYSALHYYATPVKERKVSLYIPSFFKGRTITRIASPIISFFTPPKTDDLASQAVFWASRATCIAAPAAYIAVAAGAPALAGFLLVPPIATIGLSVFFRFITEGRIAGHVNIQRN
ncbi:hypothetical protein [Parendozoicomonas haliclonae]|uniref:Uncharacterized protein n=1 Tax=Parendozoicomonas haliclonae TaxID=1960125 RepID=A0A1X7AI55_9GAMM|nr:hypothetical protein [Parendozoicomonas haliclonae]SMA42867.1 hypothetical protein EHSB41UT_01513 [Parendozoicomonas haliclonae]